MDNNDALSQASNRLSKVTDKLGSKVESILGLFTSIIGDDNISEYELEMIRTSIELIDDSNLPSTKLLSTELMSKLLRSKSDLTYIHTKLTELRRTHSIPYNTLYNKYFTLSTRKGLPSKQAIESDMMFMHKEMSEYKSNIDDYDMLIGIIDSYQSLIDMYMNILNSRRYDLG